MSKNAETLGQGSKLLVDVGPVAVFMIVYNVANRLAGDMAIYWATGTFMAATALALVVSVTTQKRFPPMLVVTFVIVMLFGGMTIYLRDPIFIYLKPTIINLIFSYAILLSFAFGFNVWKALFGSLFSLPERVWTILAIRWAVFFQFLALLNEFLWRHITESTVSASARWFDWLVISEAFWANFKFWGVMPLTLIFAMASVPITLRHNQADEASEG